LAKNPVGLYIQFNYLVFTAILVILVYNVNCSLDYAKWDSDNDTFRGYLGVGLGPTLQFQLGIDDDNNVSKRFKASFAVNSFLNGDILKTGPFYPIGGSSSDWFSRGLTISFFVEELEDDIITGIQLGILIW